MKKIYFLVLAFCFFNGLNAQVINFPDAKFKAKLLAANSTNQIAANLSGYYTKIDVNNNGEIEVTEAYNIGTLELTASSISSLQGIENFTNLTNLFCGYNALSILNVTSLSKLQFLYCNDNSLTSLEVSGLSKLLRLFCSHNKLTEINMTGLSSLWELSCSYNKFTTFDVTNLKNLLNFSCDSNQLSFLKVDGLTKIKSIDCSSNNLTSLNLSGLTALEHLGCHYNSNLSFLDVNGLTNLLWFGCEYNNLSTLDVSGLTKLTYLSCRGNQLTTLDASNSKKLNYLDCSRNKLNSLNVNGLGLLATLYLSDNILESFTGTGLNSIKTLDFRNNKLTNLDVSSSTSLESLYCDGNLLTTINVKNLNTLNELYCQNNQLTTIDLTGLNNLNKLSCGLNKIADINILGLKKLTALYCTSNLLTKIDLTGLNMLTILACGRNQLPNLNVLGLNNLKQLYCHHNLLTDIDLTGLKNLNLLSCGYNQLSSLNVTDLTNLKDFYCTNNQIKDLNLTSLTNLGLLECGNNLLTKLNISGLNKLQVLSFENNSVDTIDLSGLQNIISFNCSNNKLTTLDFSEVTYIEGKKGSVERYTYEYADGFSFFMNTCEYILNDNQLTVVNLKNSNEFYTEFSNNPKLQYICVNDAKISEIQESITQYGYLNCHVNSYCTFSPGGTYYIIQGYSRFDNNNNGCDASDIVASNIKFNIVNGATTGAVISDRTGTYSFPVSKGTHTITPIVENPSYFTISPTSVHVAFPTVATPFIQDFCITPIDTHKDLEITLIPLEAARPGFDTKYRLVYKNKGNVVQSGAVNLAFDDSVLDLVISNPAVSNQSSNNLSWSFSNLKPFETREITFTLNVNGPMETPAVNSGAVLHYTATVNSVAVDENPNDNMFVFDHTVVGSLDPNDKTCLEGDIITPSLIGEYVHYLIRFENKGTYPAQNIVVKDMIDLSKFDISTLIPTSSSHQFATKISENNKVEFIFENINLPFDDADNDGYIAFKIKTKPILKVGDSFDNEANIYFDYNFPVLTNKATSTFKTTLNTSDFEFSNYFKVYPIPVHEVLNISAIQNVEIQSIAVYDILGQLVIALPNVKDASKIDVSNLRTGNYFLKIKSDKGSSSMKFIKN